MQNQYWPPIILDKKETLEYIDKEKCSISRYGDGEVSLMALCPIGFQRASFRLRRELIKVAKVKDDKFLVCIPIIINDDSSLVEDSKKWWKSNLKLMGHWWKRYFSTGITYGDTQITRPWLSTQNKELAEMCFFGIMKQWKGKDVLLLEGEKSRLGVGNDFFSEAASVRRILGPAKNAFSKIDELFEFAKKEAKKTDIIVLALGPTATVLSYWLYKEGFRCLDCGHMDIEYEWFRMGATEKVPVKNKYVNEAGGYKTLEEDNEIDRKYLNEIIKIIK